MAIDPSLENTYGEVDRHEDHRVWTTGGEEPTEDKQGIHGARVAVDFDICIADGACPEDCPVDVFEWTDTPGHPESEIKAAPPTGTSALTACSVSMSALSMQSTLTRGERGGSELGVDER